MVFVGEMGVEHPQILQDRLIAAGLGRLALQRVHAVQRGRRRADRLPDRAGGSRGGPGTARARHQLAAARGHPGHRVAAHRLARAAARHGHGPAQDADAVRDDPADVRRSVPLCRSE